MSNEDKLHEVDTFLAMCEDFMHGKDGNDVTKCRRLINEVINELSKLHQPTVISQRELLLDFAEYSENDKKSTALDECVDNYLDSIKQ